MRKYNEQEILKKLNKETLTEEEKSALKIIYSHEKRSRVFDAYLKINIEAAKTYLGFISKNPHVEKIDKV